MSMDVEFKVTEDGSVTLYNRQVGECYHSTRGARAESGHIFIEAGLKSVGLKDVSVLEIGFGTGLNAMLTLLEAERSAVSVRYMSIEPYPLGCEVYERLNYHETGRERGLFMQLHEAEWGADVRITPYFTLHKVCGRLEDCALEGGIDVVYYDAFSPDKQPELWCEERFAALYDAMTGGAKLVTYCAKGDARRAMQRAGFTVERLPGPAGKRHIVRATKA